MQPGLVLRVRAKAWAKEQDREHPLRLLAFVLGPQSGLSLHARHAPQIYSPFFLFQREACSVSPHLELRRTWDLWHHQLDQDRVATLEDILSLQLHGV